MTRPTANQLAIALAEMIGTATDVSEILLAEIEPEALTTDAHACLRQLRRNLTNTLDIARAFQSYTQAKSALVI